MAAIDSSRVHPGNGFTGRLNALFYSATLSFSAWNEARVTRNALSRLTDRELDDIGLRRSDIERICQRV